MTYLSMHMDHRNWMYVRHLSNGDKWNQQFLDGVESLIKFATSQVHLMDGEKYDVLV